MKIAALIPAYREEKHIVDVITRTQAYLPDILVIDDGSGDRTGELARKAGAEVIVNSPNLGKGASLAIGLDHLLARGFDAAVCLDADGQHLPAEIPRFIEAAATADLIIGNRMDEIATMPFARLWTNRITSWVLSRLAGVTVPDCQCGYRLIRLKAWQAVTIKSYNYEFEGEMIVTMGRKGFSVTSVPVSTIYGDEISTIHPVRDTVRFFHMIWRLFWKRQG